MNATILLSLGSAGLLLLGVLTAVSAQDGVEKDWFTLAVSERSSQLLPSYGKYDQNDRALSTAAVIVNKRYVLDFPIQAGFLLSSPKELAHWWASPEQASLNDHFILDNRFSRGGCGEVWFARDLRDRSRRFVLKRVFKEKIMSGLREIYFGERLRGDPRVTRFIEAFNRTTSLGEDELWLVFEEEGNSLKNLLYESTMSGRVEPRGWELEDRSWEPEAGDCGSEPCFESVLTAHRSGHQLSAGAVLGAASPWS